MEVSSARMMETGQPAAALAAIAASEIRSQLPGARNIFPGFHSHPIREPRVRNQENGHNSKTAA